MSTKLPRLNVVLEPAMYSAIEWLSKKEKVSMSLIARDLLREALTLYEDIYWAKEAEVRDSTFHKSKALRHHDVWKTKD